MNDLRHEYDRKARHRGCGWFDFCLIVIAAAVIFVIWRHHVEDRDRGVIASSITGRDGFGNGNSGERENGS